MKEWRPEVVPHFKCRVIDRFKSFLRLDHFYDSAAAARTPIIQSIIFSPKFELNFRILSTIKNSNVRVLQKLARGKQKTAAIKCAKFRTKVAYRIGHIITRLEC